MDGNEGGDNIFRLYQIASGYLYQYVSETWFIGSFVGAVLWLVH